MNPSGKVDRNDLIDVAVALPVFGAFTYRVPPELLPAVAPGKRVLVPFGRRRVTAYVLNAADRPPKTALKPVVAVLDENPLFPSQMIPFFQWTADYYMHPMGEVIQTALPTGLNVAEQAQIMLSEEGRRALDNQSLAPWERAVYQRLCKGSCGLTVLKRLSGDAFSPARFSAWEREGWIVRRQTLSGGRTRPKTARFVHLSPNCSEAERLRLSAPRRKIVDLLENNGPLSMADVKTVVPTAANLVRVMARDGQVTLEDRIVYRDPLGAPIEPDRPPRLTAGQASAVETIAADLGNGFGTHLLAGVTGSGKTEIYLHLAAMALQQGLSVLVLVPEIALISQTERTFRSRFGECVALLHSGLSSGERYDQWRRVMAGEATIAVGARSAVFAPFSSIGLVIVDEEHDDSYKQEGALRYNARDLAVVRARQHGAVAVLGSATPSLQSAYNAAIGKFKRINLYERVDRQVMPKIVVKDLTAVREERGIRRFLTRELTRAMSDVLARKEQVLLFLNRRGFAGAVICGDCGQPVRCRNCDISLTHHQQANAYVCHYCGFRRAASVHCERCGSGRIVGLGIGTERLEVEIRKIFPEARTARMDRDTTRRKGALLKILKDLRDRKIDILVGTQMVAKGHDYPNITLVGIICADLSLSLPDFRAGERTFQLLAQVAGRAGRGKVPGRVVLQTYNPDHFSITAARDQDYDAFYRQEVEFRKALGYPPFVRMIQIRMTGSDQDRLAAFAQKVGATGREILASGPPYEQLAALGPIEAPLYRIANQYRWQMLIKGPGAGPLHRFVHKLLRHENLKSDRGNITIGVDVDPVFLM